MNAKMKVGLAVGIVSAVLIAAALAVPGLRRGSTESWTDGGAIRVPTAGAPVREILWQPAEPMSGMGGGSTDEYEPRYSADGTTLVFVKGKPGQHAELFTARKTAGGWSEPAAIASVNTEHDELGPELSADGRLLYFYSDRPGGLGGYDLWVATWNGEAWGDVEDLGPSVNSAWNEYGPALSPGLPSGGARVYFSSNRPRAGEPAASPDGWDATVREHRTRRDYDLYWSEVVDGSWKNAEAAAALNTAADEGAPAMSPAGDFLYFASDREGGLGGFDLYRSRVSSKDGLGKDGLGKPEGLGSAVNSLANDLDPGLTADGFRLCFSSDRAREGATAGAAVTPRYSLWSSVSREVYRSADAGAVPQKWNLLPWLVLLLLTLLPILLLMRLLGNEAWRRRLGQMGLVARCLIVSLLIHACLASLLAIWKVGSGIIDVLQEGGGGGTRVVLASGSPSGSVAGQIRGFTTGAAKAAPELTPISAEVVTGAVEAGSVMVAVPELVAAPTERLAAMVTMEERRAEPAAAVAARSVELAVELAAAAASDAAVPAAARPEGAVAEPVAARVEVVMGSSQASPVVSGLAGGAMVAVETTLSAAAVPTAGVVVEMPSAGGGSTSLISPSGDARAALMPGANSEVVAGIPTVGAKVGASDGAAEGEASLLASGVLGDSLLPAMAAAPSTGTAVAAGAGSVAVDPRGGTGGVGADVPLSIGEATPGAGRGPSGFEPGAVGGGLGLLPAAGGGGADSDIRVPETPPTPVETFDQRAPELRGELVETMGGSAATEKAVGRALDWFARHQAADGSWSAEKFDDGCGACGGKAEVKADAAMTGMVLLCYLGAGHTHMDDGPYRGVVARAIAWLIARETSDGDLRGGETLYGQTVATVALCEALAMTQDPGLTRPAQRAVSFVLARASGQANGDQRKSERDTSVLGWLVFTVESARRAGIDVPKATFDAAGKWLEFVTVPGSPGRYTYAKGKPASAAMTAEAMFVQQILGRRRGEPMMEQSAGFVVGTLPKWGEGAPTFYWYYATLALFQHQGEAWKTWNAALVRELLANQETAGKAAGSWEPTDEWSRLGGRVYQTAVCTLSLEVYYRYRAAGVKE